MNTVFKCYAAAAALLAPAAALLAPLALATRRARWVVRGALAVAVAGAPRPPGAASSSSGGPRRSGRSTASPG